MKTKNQPEVKFKEPEERIFGELKKSSRVERKKKKFHLWKFWKRNQDSRLNSCLKEENRTDSPTYQRKVLEKSYQKWPRFFPKNFRFFFYFLNRIFKEIFDNRSNILCEICPWEPCSRTKKSPKWPLLPINDQLMTHYRNYYGKWHS